MNQLIFNPQRDVRIVWRFLSFLIVAFGINIPLQILLSNILEKSLTRGYVSAFIFLISIIISLFLQVKSIDKSSFSKYGLKINKIWLLESGFGGLIASIQLSIFFIVMYLTGNLEIKGFFVTNSTDFLFLQGFFTEMFQQFVTSVAEEILHRAFLFYIFFEALIRSKVKPSKSIFLACLFSSLLFGLGHATNEGATILSTINLSIDGLIICLPFIITGRLAMSIGMHFAWNFIQGSILGFANSGYSAKASIISSELANNILTGNNFGPEGSILLIFLEIIAILLIVFWKNIKGFKHWVHPSIIEYAKNTKNSEA